MKVQVNPQYHVHTGLQKDPFQPGEQFEVDDAEGNRLISSGIVVQVQDEVCEGLETDSKVPGKNKKEKTI